MCSCSLFSLLLLFALVAANIFQLLTAAIKKNNNFFLPTELVSLFLSLALALSLLSTSIGFVVVVCLFLSLKVKVTMKFKFTTETRWWLKCKISTGLHEGIEYSLIACADFVLFFWLACVAVNENFACVAANRSFAE